MTSEEIHHCYAFLSIQVYHSPTAGEEEGTAITPVKGNLELHLHHYRPITYREPQTKLAL